MRRLSDCDIALKVLGLLLLTAAVLKGHELLTVPMANEDLGSWWPFVIFQVEFKLALGIWLLSGLFNALAWLVSLLCLGLFCSITLYKGLTSAASCGCFGSIHGDPWLTRPPGPRSDRGSPLYSKTSVPNFSNSWKLRPTRAQSQLVLWPSS